MITENLEKWVEENKIIISESSQGDSDIITIDGVGKFLFVHPFDGNIIDEDFGIILSDEEFGICDEKQVDYILFEFGGKFYYTPLKQDRSKYNEIIYKPEFNDFKYLGKCAEEEIMPFVHLGVHDEYEMMNGSGNDKLWAKKAAFLGHKALGLADRNTLAGTLAFQEACEKYKLQPIIGETIVVAKDYDPKSENLPETFELKLYVVDKEGWFNLLQISKEINVTYNGFIPDEILFQYTAGLVVVIPPTSLFNAISEDIDEGKRLIKRYKKSFVDVYYQIDTVEYNSTTLFKKHLAALDRYLCNYRKKIKPITINDAYYLDEEEHELKAMLNKVTGKAQPEAKNQFFKSVGDTLASYDEWLDDVEPLFEAIVEGIKNTNVLADQCQFRINNSERKIPKFEVEDPEALFFEVLQKGIDEKLVGKIPDDKMDEYMKRIEFECSIIVPNDLCSYLLILWDIVTWSRKQGYFVGPGRGSVCGSLVAYCMDITQVDPIPLNLYFERFLNLSRVAAHHSYTLTMEDGSEYKFSDGDRVPLVGGGFIEASKDVDWKSIDIDVKAIVL